MSDYYTYPATDAQAIVARVKTLAEDGKLSPSAVLDVLAERGDGYWRHCDSDPLAQVTFKLKVDNG